MKSFIKRWGALGGTGLLCWLLGVGMTDFGYHLKQAVIDTRQEGRLSAVEQEQANHREEAKPLVTELHLVSRKMDGLLIWLRIVANREGWPPPPEPAALSRPQERGTPWFSEAQAAPLCGPGDCP